MISYMRHLSHYHWPSAIIFMLILSSSYGGRHSFRQLCITEEQQRGRCVPVKQCDIVLTMLRKESLTLEDIQFLYGTECGRTAEGKALVCCPQSSLIPAAASEVGTGLNSSVSVKVNEKTTVKPVEITVKPATKACGLQTSVKLSNHTIGHHPWTVLLHYGNQAHDTKFNCSGTLIKPDYVLTSASCVDDVKAWKHLTVRLGEWDLESTVDCIRSTDSDELVCADPSYDVPVAQVIIHEGYNGKGNDIALLKLAQPAKLNEWVNTICLPASPVLNENAACTVAGWNQNTCEDPSSRFKLLSSYYALNRTVCNGYLPAGAGNMYNFMCVITDDKPLNDAGGGLTAERTIDPTDRQPVHELIGVLSSVPSCVNFERVSVYTRVALFMHWIETTLIPDSASKNLFYPIVF